MALPLTLALVWGANCGPPPPYPPRARHKSLQDPDWNPAEVLHYTVSSCIWVIAQTDSEILRHQYTGLLIASLTGKQAGPSCSQSTEQQQQSTLARRCLRPPTLQPQPMCIPREVPRGQAVHRAAIAHSVAARTAHIRIRQDGRGLPTSSLVAGRRACSPVGWQWVIRS